MIDAVETTDVHKELEELQEEVRKMSAELSVALSNMQVLLTFLQGVK